MARADEMLALLIGPNGDGGYLGELNKIIGAAPPISIAKPSVDTSLTLRQSTTPVPTFDDGKLGEFPDENIPQPVLQEYPEANIAEPVLASFPVEQYEAPKLSEFPDENYPAPAMTELPEIDVSGLRHINTDIEHGDATLFWESSPLTSDIYPTVLTRLLFDLREGSTGLLPEVEEAIYLRARIRQQRDRQNEYDRIVNTVEAMHFQLPGGVLLSGLAGYANGANRLDAEIEAGIIEKSADLAQKNSEFAMEKAVQIEELIRRTWDNEENRRLDYEKARVDFLIQDYAERVRGVTAKIEAEKAYISAQAEYLRGVIDSNRGKIDIYTAQYSALKTRIDAVASKNDSAVDVFKVLNDSFKTRVDAVATQNSSAVDVYRTKNDVYKTQVEAASAQNSNAVEVYKAQNDAFRTRIDAVSAKNKNLADVYGAQISGYGEEQRAISQENQSRIEALKARVQAAELEVRAAIAEAEQTIAAYSTEMSLHERAISSMAGIAAQSVASWAGAVNASASLGYSGSESRGEQWSHSDSLHESHSYEHDPTT